MNNALNDLIFIGQMTKTVTVVGKKFEIRTLTSDEQLSVTQMTKDYDPLSRVLALKITILSKAIVSIDDEAIVDRSKFLEQLSKIQIPVINKLYNEYDALVVEQNDKVNDIDAIKNSSTMATQG